MCQPIVAIMFMSDNFFKKTDFININFVNFCLCCGLSDRPGL